MDNEILKQLKNIGQQLEKITKLLEEKKSFTPKRDLFSGKKSFGDRKPFGKGGSKDFDRKPRYSESRFKTDSRPRIIADGRNFGFKDKKRNY
jgi:hypothetical protein